MSGSLRFNIPVFTTQDSYGEYVARPLLVDGPAQSHPQYQRALDRCAGAIRDKLPDLLHGQDELRDLLWHNFSPDLTLETLDLTFESGQRVISGSYAAIWFEVGSVRYVCLPGFNDLLFIARANDKGKYNLKGEVKRVIQALYREQRADGDSMEPAANQASKRDGITYITVSKYVRLPSPRSPAEDASLLLSAVVESFHGSVEAKKVAKDLTERHLCERDLDRAFLQNDLVQRLQNRMYGDAAEAIALVGPPGVGKTAVLHEAITSHLESARDAGATDYTAIYKQPKVWHLDPQRVIAGMSRVGMWQRRLEAVLSYVRERLQQNYGIARSDIVYIDNPVALLRLGQSAKSDLTMADVLKPHLNDRTLPIVLEATPDSWTRLQELDQRFADLFTVLRLSEPTTEEAWQIIAHQRADLEQRRSVQITTRALMRVRDLQHTLSQRRVLPGRVADALDRLVSRYGNQSTDADIDADAVDELFLDRAALREDIARTDVALSASDVRQEIQARLVGQPDATECLVDVVSVAKTRLGDPTRPLASLLFIGPTGVGKTEAAKVLQSLMFDNPEGHLRFNMNEYVDEGAVARLVGDLDHPDGHLTNKVRFQPACVVLLDEIEKAHSSVHNLLLQVLDEGRLTDGLGRAVDFSQTVLVMTSNLGAEEAASALGFSAGSAKDEARSQTQVYRSAVEDYFRPEFVNRIDRTVSFQSLDLEAVKNIARLQIHAFIEREGLTRRTVFLNLTDRALDRVARLGFDPDFGGRALKRSIEQDVAPLVADVLVQSTPEDPILLNLYVREGTLHPHATPLTVTGQETSVTEGFDEVLSSDTNVRSFYKALLERVRAIRHDVAGDASSTVVYDESSSTDGNTDPNGAGDSKPLRAQLQFLLYKDRVRDLQTTLEHLVNDISARPPNTRHFTLTLRRPRLWPIGWDDLKGRPSNFPIKAYFALLDIRQHLNESYVRAERALQNAPEETVRRYVEAASLHFLHPVFAEDTENASGSESQGCCLHLRSLLDGRGLGRVTYLRDRLEAVTQLFVPDEATALTVLEDTPSGCYLHVPFPRMETLFAPEAGVHLFFEAYGGDLPAQLRVLDIPEEDSPDEVVARDRMAYDDWLRRFESGTAREDEMPWALGPIVRMYTPPAAGQDGTIKDLRSGLMDRFDADRYAWFLWIYSALPEADRLSIPAVDVHG